MFLDRLGPAACSVRNVMGHKQLGRVAVNDRNQGTKANTCFTKKIINLICMYRLIENHTMRAIQEL